MKFVPVALAMFLGSLGRPLRAQEVVEPVEPFVQLTFSGTPSCLDTSRVRSDIESSLGRPVFREQGAPYVLSVETGPASPLLRVTLQNQLTGEILGIRELQTQEKGCDEYQAVLPVVVTVLLDPYMRDREARASERTKEEVAPIAPAVSDAPPVESAPVMPPDFRCGLSAGVIVGFAPHPSTVGRQACTFRLPPDYDIDLSISYRFPGTATGSELSFAVQAIELRLAFCRGFGARLRFGVCAAASLAGTIARTSAGGQAQPDDFRVIGELAAFGRLDYDFSSLGFIRFDLGLFAPLVRPIYTHQEPLELEPTRLHQASFVAGHLEVGAGFHWW